MTKRIVLLDTGKEWGGGTNSLLELLKRIDRGKFDFTCVFYDDYRKGDGPRISEELARLGIGFVHLPRRASGRGAKFLKELLRVLLFFSKRLRRMAIFMVDYYSRIRPDADRIAGVLRQRSADLLYLNNQPSTNLEGIIAARTTGVPAVQHSRIDAALNAIEVRIANEGLHRIICVSDGVRQRLVEQGIDGAKCVVVHNGIDAATRPLRSAAEIRAAWGIGENEILIGTVGSLVRRKRIADLIDAMALLIKQKGRSLKCLIVGSGPERSTLAARAEQLGVAERVIFTGFQADAVSHIGALDIFVLPSEKEGLPRVILESMVLGKPVVASNVIGPAELVIDAQTGFLLPVAAIPSWVRALERLISDWDLRKRMGEAGRRRALDVFSIEKYVAGVSAVLAG